MGRVLPKNAAFVRATLNNIAVTGDSDIYTVPAGKIAIVGRIRVYNNNGSLATVYPTFKLSGTYFRIVASPLIVSANSSTSATINRAAPAGTTIAVNTTLTGINVWIDVLLLNADCGFVPIALTSLAAGDNTIYTCPANKTAVLIDSNNLVPFGPNTLAYTNQSGATRTIKVYQVNSGGSSSTSNLIMGSSTVTNNSCNTGALSSSMTSGDSLILNTDASTASQAVFGTVLELPL